MTTVERPLNAFGETKIRTIDSHDPEAFTHWLRIRQEYMEAQGWHYGDDHDVYDENPETLHIINVDKETGEIRVGMRLTPCEDPERSLSWSMMSPAIRAQARQNLPPNDEVNFWDLTRLVPGPGITKATATNALLEVFGAGLHLSEAHSESHPRWLFATTPSFAAFFRRQGIIFTELARGLNGPTDKHDTVLCYADPAQQTANIREGHFPSYDAVLRGIKAA